MANHCVYIGVGSNIDPEGNIFRALELLARRMTLDAVSTFYQSAPLLFPDQAAFLNGVARGWTALDARTLKFDVLRTIESALGRVRTENPYAARPIDLDILLFNAIMLNEPGLCVPDPDIWNRAFLAVPLMELNPDLVLPDRCRPLVEAPCLQSRADLIRMDSFTRQLRERLGVGTPNA